MQRSFYKNVRDLFSGTVLAQGIAFGFIPVLTRIYTPEDFGTLAVFTSLIGLFAIFTTGRYDQAIMLPEDEKKSASVLVLSQLVNVLVSLMLLVVVYFLGDRISLLLDIPDLTGILYFLPFSVFLLGCIQSFQIWLNRKKKYQSLAANKIIQNGTTSVSRLAYMPISFGLIIGTITGYFFTLLHALFISLKDFKLLRNTSYMDVKKVAYTYHRFPKYSLPSAFMNNFSKQIPVFLITKFFSEKITGYYSNAVRLVLVPLSFISNSVAQVYYEQAARNKENYQELSVLTEQILIRLFWIGVFPISILVVFGDIFIPLFLGAAWEETGVYVRFLSLFYFLYYIVSPLTYLFEVYDKLAHSMIFNFMLLAGRTAAICIGFYFFQSIYISIILLALTGVFVWLSIFFYLSGLVRIHFFKLFFRAAGIQILILFILFTVKYVLMGYV